MPERSIESRRALLRSLFDAAVAAADPAMTMPAALAQLTPPKGRTVVLGAGKAAASMAAAAEAHWPGALSGLVVTRYGHGAPTQAIEVVEASHPLPDDAGAVAARRMLAMAAELSADDLALFLISGGGSSLIGLPADGVDVEEHRALSKALLNAGADIGQMNCVRKHLSAISGGRLALAAGAAAKATLLISDVPGDEPDVIASGPTVPDPTTLADARAILTRFGIEPGPTIAARLNDPGAETPAADDPAFADAHVDVFAKPIASLRAAAEAAQTAGYTPIILGDAIEGEARECGRVMAGLALGARTHGAPLPAPCALISGGETTVTVRGGGRGGRNAEWALGFALTMAEQAGGFPLGIAAIAGDTDGVDGVEDCAAALVDETTADRARAAGVDLVARLADNDAYNAFHPLGDLVVTGPTRTNVNDFRAILVD